MKFTINKKQLKILAVLIICATAIIAGYVFFVKAQFFTDTFTTEDDVAATWRITVATTTGEVKLEEKSCDDAVWFCGAGFNDICGNALGDGDYILVKRTDVGSPTTQQWKTANTACDQPQCGIDGGQTDDLVADNTVNFGVYLARDACKALGGRLPTKTELNCMYTNKATFGNNFVAANYWASTENSATHAWNQYFSTGSVANYNKPNSLYVRCVRGW
ncbi:DUF1566 domain-containing protein [Patescibacteria group bacterium]|nr:DUF1566 domain-containing protein [Patescibacteria group bacterium]